MVKKKKIVGRSLGWLTPTSYISRTRATTAVIGERKVIPPPPPSNAWASEAVFCWIYIICLSIKWAKLGITLQRWNIMLCVMHFWELWCCFIGERLASSISLLASWVIKVRRFIPQYFGHEEDNSLFIGLEGKTRCDVWLFFMRAGCVWRSPCEVKLSQHYPPPVWCWGFVAALALMTQTIQWNRTFSWTVHGCYTIINWRGNVVFPLPTIAHTIKYHTLLTLAFSEKQK